MSELSDFKRIIYNPERERAARNVANLSAEVRRLRAVLQDISEAPCSMVNDSESIRFSFNQVSAQARNALKPQS